MKKLVSVILLLGVFVITARTQTTGSETELSTIVQPELTFPLGADASIYGIGGGASARLVYPIGLLEVGLGVGYGFFPLQVLPEFGLTRSVSTANIGLSFGVSYPVLERLSLGLHAGGGYYAALFNEDNPVWGDATDPSPVASDRRAPRASRG